MEKGIKKGIEKGIKKGRKEGVEEGMEKGIEKGREEVAKNLLLSGISIDVIIKTTGLTKEQLDRIRNV